MKKTLMTLAALAMASVASAAVPTPDRVIPAESSADYTFGDENGAYTFSFVIDLNAALATTSSAGSWDSQSQVSISDGTVTRGVYFYNNPDSPTNLLIGFNHGSVFTQAPSSSSVVDDGNIAWNGSYPLYSIDAAYEGSLALTFTLTATECTLYVARSADDGSLTHDTFHFDQNSADWSMDWNNLTVRDNASAISDLAIYNHALSSDEAKAVNAQALGVPEPTTATLSLLALAGLAARRRRK